MAQVEAEGKVGTGLEVMCSQFEGRVPVVEARVPVVGLTGGTATEVLSPVAVNVSAAEVRGPGHEVVSPLLETGSVDEVRRSVVESVFFAIRSAASVIHEGPVGLGDLRSEVTVSVAESIGPVVKAADPVLDMWESTLISLWLIPAGLMGHTVSELIAGMTGEVGSGLVPGLKG